MPVRPALVEVRFRRPMPGTRANESWSGREADTPLPTPRSQAVSILQG